MSIVTVQDAKTHLSRLLKAVEAGEEIIIARGQTPVARLVAIEPAEGRVFGAARGLYGSPPGDAFAPLDAEELALWSGE